MLNFQNEKEVMLVREVYKYCMIEREKKKGNNPYKNTIWEKLRDEYYYKRIYMGVCDFAEYDVWHYSRHFGYWVYYTTKENFDVLTSFLNREV
jgi:hypothetical protein